MSGAIKYCGVYCLSTSVSPATSHSIDCSTFINRIIIDAKIVLILTASFNNQLNKWRRIRCNKEQNVSWCFLTTRFACHLKVHYRVHKNPETVKSFNYDNLYPSRDSNRVCLKFESGALPLRHRYILMLSSHLGSGLVGGLFPSSFTTKNFFLYFSSTWYVLHAPLTPFSLMCSS
jgi:hypothetical protein